MMGDNNQLPASPLQGRRILIVEDEMLVAMEIKGLLRRQDAKSWDPRGLSVGPWLCSIRSGRTLPCWTST
jgi:hypothetical protein